MCTTCGCNSHDVLINGKRPSRQRAHVSVAYRPHGSNALSGAHVVPATAHAHHRGREIDGSRIIQVERDILAKNDALAVGNRTFFAARRTLALNMVSSPGSGKTTLLVRTLQALKERFPLAVIEGDQQTDHDAERIRATGVTAIQINTGKGCHLDADMVCHALEQLDLAEASLLFIENVGNLVCPAAFDLGEMAKVVVLSVTEGEDKPLKYPDIFRAAKLMLLNKCDLLPYLAFDIELAESHARRINPDIEIIRLSAIGGEGMDAWLAWLVQAWQELSVQSQSV